MSTSADAPTRSVRRRRYLWASALLLLFATAAAVVWWIRRAPAGPVPPVVPPNVVEPNVTALVEKIRGEVLKEPRSERAWGRLGQAFIANDMDDEAEICFAEAERLDPANPRWPYYRGGMRINHGELDAALPLLRRGAERCDVEAPDNCVPRLMLAETLLTLGRLDESEEQFRQVLARQDEEVRAHYGLGLVYAARQDWKASRTHLLRCLGHLLSRQKASVQLAAVCLRLGQQDEAEKYRRLAERVPVIHEWPDPFVTEYLVWAVKKRGRYRHVELLEAAGRYRQAAEVVLPMTEEYPDDYLPRLTLAKMVGRLGQHERAERLLREALRLAPDKVQVYYYLSLILFNRAEALERNGQRDQAAQYYREAAQRAREALDGKADYGFAYMTLGLSLKGLGQRADALKALREAVRCNPEHAELHFYLGELLADDGQTKEARQRLEQALDLGAADAAWRKLAQARLTALDRGDQPSQKPSSAPK